MMHRLGSFLLALAAAPFAFADLSGSSGAPTYITAGVVNAASQSAQPLAPNTIATLYGTNLSYNTHAVGIADLQNNTLPTTMGGTTLYVNGSAANLFYISPGQINFLVPYAITASVAAIYVVRDGTLGPTITVPIAAVSPALFLWPGNAAVALHLSGQPVSATAPAAAGEIVTLYANGLGRSQPDTNSGLLPQQAAQILDLKSFSVLLNNTPVPAGNLLYAGLAPGFSGLYQINLLLPADVPANPQIQLALDGITSPGGVLLPLQ